MTSNETVLAFGIAEAAKTLGLGRTNLYRLVGEGRISAVQCGGRTLIPADSLRAFLASLPAAPIKVKAGAI